jgi:hypothetical protein
VWIKGPCPGHQEDEARAVEFEVPVIHWDFVDIIKVACQDSDTLDSFHTTQFREMWKGAAPIWLYGEGTYL